MVTESLDRAEIVCAEHGPAAFQLLFKAGRGGPGGRTDQRLLRENGLAARSRVVLVVQLGTTSSVLVDGIITHREYVPGDRPGAGVVAVTGDDLTVVMDAEQRIEAYPAMGDAAIVAAILARYARHGITAQVVAPAVADQPLPDERLPVQHGTDLEHLVLLAQRAGHVFTLRPGPQPLRSVAYWGPPAGLAGRPLPALSVATGTAADITNVTFRHDGREPVRVNGHLQDAASGRVVPVGAAPPTRSALARRPEPGWRTVLAGDLGGLDAGAASGQAQAIADASARSAVVAEGEVDSAGYGAVLTPHRLVGLRGAGWAFDGLYRVQRVTHVLRRGAYRQRFRLARPGTESTTRTVDGGQR
ncbi:hypothetical protein C1I93_10005 [Micromonospora endophytica]|uniref:Phage protein D n=1 Tax=Micromonospora endophytica TaxID=515350 RepID=A0A2W2CJE0_9ACTN|nr:hypothetical protein C1I93_10005 [Micromonospora endophytica]